MLDLQEIATFAKTSLWEGELTYEQAEWLADHGFHVDASHPQLPAVFNIRRCKVYTN